MPQLEAIKASELPINNDFAAGEIIFAIGDELYKLDLGLVASKVFTSNNYAAKEHTHTISHVIGLQLILDGKAPSNHTHTINQITGLQAALDAVPDQVSNDGRYIRKTGNVAESIDGAKTFINNVTAIAFFESSDVRLKKDIQPISDTFRAFELKSEEGKRYGVIAQEIEKTNPELVTTNAEGFKAVNYTDLLCMKLAQLENEIKELKKNV